MREKPPQVEFREWDQTDVQRHFMICTHSSPGVHLGSVAEQNSYDVRLIGTGGQMERRLSSHRRQVRVGFVLQQEYHDVHASHETGDVQRSEARLRTRNRIKIYTCRYIVYDFTTITRFQI